VKLREYNKHLEQCSNQKKEIEEALEKTKVSPKDVKQ
jgi:hypothetical protein